MEKQINNIFRSNTQLLKNYFIDSLVGKLLDESMYVHATLPFDWIIYGISRTVKKIKKATYEERLKEIIETPSNKSLNVPLISIIGGIGTGKTTVYKHVLSESITCHDCTPTLCDKEPFILSFDFCDINRIYINSTKNSDGNKEKDFWLIISNTLKSLIKIGETEEVTNFWKWLINSNIRVMLSPLFKKLEANKPFIMEGSKKLNDLLNERKNLIDEKLSLEQLCIYQLYILRYQRRNYNNYCHLSVFDNLDNLIPVEQYLAIDFGCKVYDILHCPVLIPMRPFTFSRHNGAYDFLEVIDHYSADLFEVLTKRSKALKNSGIDKALILGTICEKLIEKIKSEINFSVLFEATSGISIRFALRNFYNLLLSQLLQAEIDGTTNLDSWKSNEFYEAYLCHEMPNNLMDTKNFCNLYVINFPDVPVYYSNLKIRFLNRLFNLKERNISLSKFYNEILSFGYKDDEFLCVLNELMSNERPLIYSNMYQKYDSVQQIDHNHGIMLTPVGERYYKSLLGEPQYLKECIFQKEQNRFDKKLDDWLPKAKEILEDLFNEDKNEIQSFISNKSISQYLQIFPDRSGISLEIWKKHRGLFAFFDMINLEYDKEYHNYIQKEIKDLLSIF